MESTGLGLAIVKHTADRYGGTVRLQSELGKYTGTEGLSSGRRLSVCGQGIQRVLFLAIIQIVLRRHLLFAYALHVSNIKNIEVLFLCVAEGAEGSSEFSCNKGG